MDNTGSAKSPEQTANSGPVYPPPTAQQQNDVTASQTQESGNNKSTAKELAREFRWFEILSLVINGVLALIGIGALYVYNGQLNVMRGQLDQMRRRGADQDRGRARQ